MMLLRQSTHRMTIRYDPDIGFLYVPNLTARIPHESGAYYVRTNAMGFRSDVEYHRAKGSRPRILVFGDSYTAGDGCSNHERFSDRMGRHLNADVYNYGLSGSGTDQHLLIYERFARDVEADLLILCVNVENIERIKAGHRASIDRVTGARVMVPKPYFTLEDDALRLHHVPVPRHRPHVDSGRTAGGAGFAGSITRWLRRLARLQSPIPAFLGEPAGRMLNARLTRLRGALLRSAGFQPHADYRSAASPGWQLMRAIVERFRRSAAPIPVLLVPLPTYPFYLHGLPPLYQPLFESLADPANGLHVADLTRPLAELPWDTRYRLSFDQDSHFCPFGHEQVARLLCDTVLSRGLLRKPPLPAHPAPPKRPQKQPTYILGLSCFYHDSAAALIKDGRIVAAAEEERFSRVKNDRRFPQQAANYCLEEAGLQPQDLTAAVYYDNAALTMERLMHSLLVPSSHGEAAWLRMMPSWVRYKLRLPRLIRRALGYDGLVLHDRHHRAHAASAFYPSPFPRAALLTVDGVGEWATASLGVGRDNRVHLLKEMHFPHSLGLLYSAFTQFTGFKANDGEYKMMGLAPYGQPEYVSAILEHLVDLKEDGSLSLNLEYFSFLSGATMTNDRFAGLFGGPPRQPESRITRREMDLARSIQVVTEEAVLRMARYARRLTGERFLCMAGGVALNCVANGRLLREGPFDDVWIQPAAGDAGAALGAALDAYHQYFDGARDRPLSGQAAQGGSYWGPAFSQEEVRAFLDTHGYPYRTLDPVERADAVAGLLESGRVVGHFSGRSEFGPRALGARSILGDARNADMQVTLNLKIKFRESFRPFAPSVLLDKSGEYFDMTGQSPYMLLVAPVKERRRTPSPPGGATDDLLPLVRRRRSDIPAVTHVDYSARIQTVAHDQHPAYYDLIRRFHQRTGCGVIVNTSFNVRGEPIVCTPYDAYRCFMRTDMDALVLENCLLLKAEQPSWPEAKGHLERETEQPPAMPRGFLRGLRRIYATEFVPAGSSLGAQRLLRIYAGPAGPTMWKDADPDESPKAIFAVSGAIDTAAPNPELMARAVTDAWAPGPVTDALRPVLASLIRLGQHYPAAEALEEQVPESVYVMF